MTFAAVLPSLDILSVKLLGWSAKTKDLQLSRFSVLLSIVGFGTLIIASSVELVVLGKHIIEQIYPQYRQDLALIGHEQESEF